MSDCHYLEPKGKSREALVRHLPLGIAWDAFRLPGRTAYKWIGALAEGYERAWEALCAVTKELNPYTTRQMIGEWEESVSLPDKCLPKASTLQERRDWVVWRLTKRRWTTVAEWKELAALFGVEILVVPGWLVQKPALYPFEYPKRYDLFPKLGRFRVYINIKGFEQQGYDYGIRGDGYPVPYGLLPSADASGFRCIIERVKPANVVIIWNGLTSAMYPAEKLLFDLPEDLPEAEADGILEEDMAVGPESVITEQSIVVRLAFGKPKPATEAEMMDGANVAAIQDLVTGKWEVIQFRDVEKLTGARYRLTGLIRAQIG
ncbi:MAG: putative phage tail protein, partial [Dichotomicrobium sp.]